MPAHRLRWAGAPAAAVGEAPTAGAAGAAALQKTASSRLPSHRGLAPFPARKRCLTPSPCSASRVVARNSRATSTATARCAYSPGLGIESSRSMRSVACIASFQSANSGCARRHNSRDASAPPANQSPAREGWVLYGRRPPAILPAEQSRDVRPAILNRFSGESWQCRAYPDAGTPADVEDSHGQAGNVLARSVCKPR